jgi:N-acyl homoserine lactone hydrolase
MKVTKLVTWGGVTLGALGMGLAINSFLPQRFLTDDWVERKADLPSDTVNFPEVEVVFLRCGSITIPEPIAVRGAFTLAPCVISHSAVLIRHPRALFLYDTGLSSDIYTYLLDQSLFFRKTLANFQFEQSLSNHLKERGIARSDLDFALLSHLHWDHVSGISDIPGVPLRINRVEYEAAKWGLLEARNGLVRRLMGDNPLELFDCAGPFYKGFRSSFDLFGDGSIVLVPLPGHTAGNTGMFVNRSNGPGLFLLGDAVWVSQNYLRPATMHPFIWSRVTSDDATARQTLIDLHNFALQHPEIPLIAMHDAELQEKFMVSERQVNAAGRYDESNRN